MKHDEVEQLRDTITGSGLVDDLLESAHSREKAELQKALAARISEVENLAADVAHEREKNTTQAESIGQCFDEIDRLKRLVALRTQDLAVHQKELEVADNRADKAECYSKFRLAYMCKRIDLERIKRSEYPMWFKLFVRLLFPIGLIVTWLINSELEDEHDRIVALYERYFGELS